MVCISVDNVDLELPTLARLCSMKQLLRTMSRIRHTLCESTSGSSGWKETWMRKPSTLYWIDNFGCCVTGGPRERRNWCSFILSTWRGSRESTNRSDCRGMTLVSFYYNPYAATDNVCHMPKTDSVGTVQTAHLFHLRSLRWKVPYPLKCQCSWAESVALLTDCAYVHIYLELHYQHVNYHRSRWE